MEPIPAIIDAFRTCNVVALDEGHHTNEAGAKFRLKLLHDPRFSTIVNDIVVECGNALYQDVMDRFTEGEEVPYEKLRMVWQNTTQPHDVWDHQCYEEFFREVRQLNQSLSKGKRLRVLLGDPPIDWSKIHNAKEFGESLGERDTFPVGLIQREVLAKKRRALVVYGGMHLLRKEPDSIVDRLEKAGAKVFSIWVNSFCDLELVQNDVRTWQDPALFLLKGTIPGEAEFKVFYPFGERKDSRKVRMEDKVDAMLYLGHPLTFTYSPMNPALFTDEKYISMRVTRIGYMSKLIVQYGGKVPREFSHWAEEFKAQKKQPPNILPQLWRTYIASGMPAALAILPTDRKHFIQEDDTLNKLSEAVLRRGASNDAIMAASKNAELFPKKPGPFLALGAAYLAKGEKSQSLDQFRYALKLDPGNKTALQYVVMDMLP